MLPRTIQYYASSGDLESSTQLPGIWDERRPVPRAVDQIRAGPGPPIKVTCWIFFMSSDAANITSLCVDCAYPDLKEWPGTQGGPATGKSRDLKMTCTWSSTPLALALPSTFTTLHGGVDHQVLAQQISRAREQANNLLRLPGPALRRGDQTAFPHKLMSTSCPIPTCK